MYNLELEQGNDEKALNWLKAGVQAIGETEGLLIAMGVSYFVKEGYSQANECFDKVLKLNRLNAEATLYRGCTFYEMGNFTMARVNLNKAIGLRSQQPHAYLYRGFVNEELGDKKKAMDDFSIACNNGLEEACDKLE